MPSWRDARGFTLAELLVAFAVLALILSAVTTIHQSVLQAYVVGSNKAEVQQNARVALDRIARELRQTPLALTTAAATSLTLVDQDTGLAVVYALTGDAPNATLTRTTNGVTDVVLGGLQALSFAYTYCTDPGCGTNPASVRQVAITVQTRSEDTAAAGGVADSRARFTTSVRLRNL